MSDKKIETYAATIKQLKSAILASRYRAAALVNRELLALYFNVGKLIEDKSKQGKWGDKVLGRLSNDLQKELPGLKGFSATNIKRMRAFYKEWNTCFTIGPTPSDQLQKKKGTKVGAVKPLINPLTTSPISPTLSDQFIQYFFSVSFSHHYQLLVNTKTAEERRFYITGIATEFWSLETLKHHLKNKLFRKKGTLQNNFSTAITNENLRAKALQCFKDEYLLDFINIEETDEEDQTVIENEIVRNIKKFLLSLGVDFAFVSSQYRLLVEGEEYFTDLLFFNRKLQCLVAFDLKKGKFKPEYAGKMNFYLSGLDEYVKQPHELPAIGIILCKEKNNKIIEFSFRDMAKPLGVATYKTSNKVPKQFKNALPDPETLKKLMG
jgi:predicted nuclease of restriction endonuclease-like (RecB) superfamily